MPEQNRSIPALNQPPDPPQQVVEIVIAVPVAPEHVDKVVEAGAAVVAAELGPLANGEVRSTVTTYTTADYAARVAVAANLLARHSAAQDRLAKAELSPQETLVARGIARGLSNREIGAEMFIAEATVKTYASTLMEKLHTPNRTAAAAVLALCV